MDVVDMVDSRCLAGTLSTAGRSEILVGVSRENIERARRGYEAFNSGDMEGALEFIDPDFELHSGADLPDPTVYQKREGFLANIREWSDVFRELHYEPEEFIEAGDRLIALVRVSGRGRGSGAEFEQRQAHVWTIRDEKAVRLDFYPGRAEAEEAVGLRANPEAPAS
jgi:ketosteroid isomerase-like protein